MTTYLLLRNDPVKNQCGVPSGRTGRRLDDSNHMEGHQVGINLPFCQLAYQIL